MPADTRCPDHSIWDHLRVTTALAFLSCKIQNADDPRAPWLLRFSIGPVQRFIEKSRTTRDLWLSSFLLSDLIWHAMLPIIQRYGPDCIVYPDLQGNPGWTLGSTISMIPPLAFCLSGHKIPVHLLLCSPTSSSLWFLGADTIICNVSKTCRDKPKLKWSAAGRSSLG
jgi:CRISPR-associated protein